jgi:hypothetical protein
MIVRLTERDAGPLPRVRNRNPPDEPRYAQPAGRRSDGRSPAAGPLPRRRIRDAPVTRTSYPLTSIASLLPSLSDNQPARTAISTLTDRGTSRFDRIQTAHPARYTI